MSTPQAIPTFYDGIQFRSRLEARWAVFMNYLGVEWEYEPEAYGNGVIGYLPDFWIPKLDCFLEIKPVAPTDEEIEKAELLEEATGKTLYFMIGRPITHDKISDEWMANCGGLISDYPHYWFTCDACKDVRIIYAWAGRARGGCCDGGGDSTMRALAGAVVAANNFRFDAQRKRHALSPRQKERQSILKQIEELQRKAEKAESRRDTESLLSLLKEKMSLARKLDGI